MKIDTEITKRDLIAVNFLLWPKIRMNWIVLSISSLFFFATCLNSVRRYGVDLETVGFSALVGIAIALTVTVVGFVFCVAVAVANANERTGLGRHSYEILDEGLREKTRLNEEISNWVGFQGLWKFSNYMILQRSWAALHIFPGRCFVSEAEFNAFHKELESHVKPN